MQFMSVEQVYGVCTTVPLCCRLSLAEIKEKSSEARHMLESWKRCYQEVRDKIEHSGRDARWEFDRKRLFDRSDHIAQVCRDIHNIAQVSICSIHLSLYLCVL